MLVSWQWTEWVLNPLSSVPVGEEGTVVASRVTLFQVCPPLSPGFQGFLLRSPLSVLWLLRGSYCASLPRAAATVSPWREADSVLPVAGIFSSGLFRLEFAEPRDPPGCCSLFRKIPDSFLK